LIGQGYDFIERSRAGAVPLFNAWSSEGIAGGILYLPERVAIDRLDRVEYAKEFEGDYLSTLMPTV
jgi:hypothetical protein